MISSTKVALVYSDFSFGAIRSHSPC